MLKREDFPPSMPREDVDRVLAIQAQGRWPFALPALLLYGAFALILFGAAKRFFDLPAIASGLLIPIWYGMARAADFIKARDIQKLLVEFGHTCPRCHKPVYSDTWSMAQGKAERDALIQGYCPRCFEHIGPNVLVQVDAAVGLSEARRAAERK